jgi:hypothetical protein
VAKISGNPAALCKCDAKLRITQMPFVRFRRGRLINERKLLPFRERKKGKNRML